MSHRARLLFENGLIILGLLTFWPFVFGHRSLPYLLWMVAILGLLAGLAFVRLRRVIAAINAHKSQPPGGLPPYTRRN